MIAAVCAALAIGMLAAPAAAANPLLAFVNGIAGLKVDVCIGTQEVRSNLKYGAWFQRSVAPGTRVVRFRRAAPGRCTGQLLGTENLNLAVDDDYTLVAARLPDKVVLFDNTPVPVGPGVAGWNIRHAADVGDVVISLAGTTPFAPTALPPTWSKGDEFRTTSTSIGLLIAATREGRAEALAGPTHVYFLEGQRTEAIVVGNKPKNARFVVFARPNLPV